MQTLGEAATDPWARYAQIDNAWELERMLEDVPSYVDEVLILHRLAQLRLHLPLPGLLSARELSELRERLEALQDELAEAEQAVESRLQAEEAELLEEAREWVCGSEWREEAELQFMRSYPDYVELKQQLDEVVEGRERWYEELHYWKIEARRCRDRGDREGEEKVTQELEKAELMINEASRKIGDLEKGLHDKLVLVLGRREYDPDLGWVRRGGEVDGGRIYEEYLKPHRKEIAKQLAKLREKRREELLQGYLDEANRIERQLREHRRAEQASDRVLDRCRRLRPRFEAQRIDASLERNLRRHPGKVRAIFVRESLLRDHLLYAEWQRPREPQSGYQRTLIFRYDGPSISSVRPKELRGKRAAKQWEAELMGLDYHAVLLSTPEGTDQDYMEHLRQYAPMVYRYARQDREHRQQLIGFLRETAERSEVRPTTRWRPARTARFSLFGEVEEGECEERLVKRLLQAGARPAEHRIEVPEYESWAKIEPGTRFELDLGEGMRLFYVPHHSVSTTYQTKYVHRLKLRLSDDQLRQLETELSDKPKALAGLRQLARGRRHLQVQRTCTTPDPPKPNGTEQERSLYRQLLKQMQELAGDSEEVRCALAEPAVRAALKHEVKRQVKRTYKQQQAPFSERGTLRVDGATPRRAVEKLQELGIIGGVCEQVPYELIYRGRRRYGRVIPLHRDFASLKEVVQLPEPHYGVIHGMTGVRTDEQVLDRLERIVQSGGLKSTAERRRLGIGVMSMSPRGDIASGVDWGVPCKIDDNPLYGNRVWFVFKPEVLTRRDLWFSDMDFGEGHNRFREYNDYAAYIGQGKFYHPPSPSARDFHLQTGLREDNEVWFKDELTLEEVDSIIVDKPGLAQKIRKRMEAWKRSGRVPKELKVISCNRNIPVSTRVRQRAQELNSRPIVPRVV